MIRTILPLILVVSLASPLHAQVVREVIPAPERVSGYEGDRLVLEGPDVPRVELVSNFMLLASHKRQDEVAWGTLLDALEMAPGSPASGILSAYVTRGGELVRRSLPQNVGPAEIESVIRSLQRRKSEDLGGLWTGLEQALAAHGYDFQILERYVDEEVRRGTQIVITGVTAAEIEDQLAELREREARFHAALGGQR